MKIASLLYHHVGPRPPDSRLASLSVRTSRFERQMSWLARRGFVGIRPSEWLRWRRHGVALPSKPVLLTFDDAYADFADFALPVLKRFNFSATVFVITRKIGGVNSWDGARLMSARQILDCHRDGIEIAAHSRTHAELTGLSRPRLVDEVAGSAGDLADLLGQRATCFAYPGGLYNQEVCEVTAASFDLAFTCNEGMNEAHTDPHLLCRTMVQPGDLMIDWSCRVRLGWSPVTAMRSGLRIRSRFRDAMRYLSGQDG